MLDPSEDDHEDKPSNKSINGIFQKKHFGYNPLKHMNTWFDSDEQSDEETDLTTRRQSLLLLRLVFYFTLLFSISEVFASILSNSLLLLEESVHMFADSMSYGINLWAELKSSDEASKHSAQLIGTGVSLITLLGTLVFVIVEGVGRIGEATYARPVDAKVMLGFGIALTTFHAACLLAYYFGFNILHSHDHGHGDHGHSHHLGAFKPSERCDMRHHINLNGGAKCSHNDHIGNVCGKSSNQSDTASTVHCEHDLSCDHREDCNYESHHHHRHVSMNVASAILHVFVDFLHSAIVILTAAVVLVTKTQHVDPLNDGNSTVHEYFDNSARIDAWGSIILCVVIFAGCVAILRGFCYQLSSRYRKQSISNESSSMNIDDHIPIAHEVIDEPEFVSITLN